MTSDEIRERYALQQTCGHPQITREAVVEAQRNAYRYADSDQTWLTCPDCGLAGEADLDDNDEPILREEPKGAGADYPVVTKEKPRIYAFDDRSLTRGAIVDLIRAALEDEDLELSQGSWGRVTIAIKDGQLLAVVPSSAITNRP